MNKEKDRFVNYLYESIPLLNEKNITKDFFKNNIKCFTSKYYFDDEEQLIKESLLNDNEILLFSFYWSSDYDFILDLCKKHLAEYRPNKQFDKLIKCIEEFDEVLNFKIPLDISYYDFYFENDIIHSILNVYLFDPSDELDDGIKLILFQDTNEVVIKKETIKFLNYIYRTYFTHIYESNNLKEYSELSLEEKEIIKLLVY